MEFVDELQFPRIEKVLQLKATLLRNLKHDREVLRETNVNKLDGNNIANAIEASNGSQNLRQSSVNVSKISANSMEEPVQKKSLVAPAPASSIFAGVATRARALLNNHNEENIINRLTRVMSDCPTVRKSGSQRPSSPEVEEVVIKGSNHYHNLALAVFTNKKQSQLSKKQRLHLARRLGKCRVADLHRIHF